MGKQSMDALLVDFITNFDIDMMDATVAYCIVLYCCSTRSNVCVMRCVPEMICCRVSREQGLKKSKKPFYSHPPS